MTRAYVLWVRKVMAGVPHDEPIDSSDVVNAIAFPIVMGSLAYLVGLSIVYGVLLTLQ